MWYVFRLRKGEYACRRRGENGARGDEAGVIDVRDQGRAIGRRAGVRQRVGVETRSQCDVCSLNVSACRCQCGHTFCVPRMLALPPWSSLKYFDPVYVFCFVIYTKRILPAGVGTGYRVKEN